MNNKIIFHYNYNVYCMDCGNVVQTNVIPINYDGNYTEFSLDGFTCNCGNAENFNIGKSEIKRLVVPDLPEPVEAITESGEVIKAEPVPF